MKTYTIKQEESGKYSITYFINGEFETKEFYANQDNSVVVEIRLGYTKNEDSL